MCIEAYDKNGGVASPWDLRNVFMTLSVLLTESDALRLMEKVRYATCCTF